jgi:succinylglutamic semialdehyde dehydrogenase
MRFCRLVTVSQTLVPDAWDASPQPFLGGLISPRRRKSIRPGSGTLLAAENAAGAAAAAGRTSLLTPGIIEMTTVAEVADEEVFGPLLSVWRYDDFDEAIALANATRFGFPAG